VDKGKKKREGREHHRLGPSFARRTSENAVKAKFAEFPFRGCMKSPQTRASRLVMRRIMAAYINASPLAHILS
jgi:hypothetical protein